MNIEKIKMKYQSQVSRGGSFLTPHQIELTDNQVIYTKRNAYLIGNKIICLDYKRISSITLNTELIGTDIIIVGFGGEEIVAKNFSLSDAKQILKIINMKKI